MRGPAPAARLPRLGAALALALLLGACRATGVVPAGPLLEPSPASAKHVPDARERAASEVAVAALAGDLETADAALAKLEALELDERAAGEPASALPPVAHYVRNAALDDPAAYRSAAQTLLERDDLPLTVRRVLEEELRDDPLRLADERIGDARELRFVRVFNALAAPLGRSVLGGVLAPYRLARAGLHILVDRRLEPPISVPERQALVHWRRYLDTHPREASPERLERLGALQRRFVALKRERSLESARRALERDQPGLALLLAERALAYTPEHPETEELRERAEDAVRRRESARRRSLAASEAPPLEATHPAARELALALLDPEADLAAGAETFLASHPDDPLAPIARFARATAGREAGQEAQFFEALRGLAEKEVTASPMVRHAQAILASPVQNPYAAFREARRRQRLARGGWVLLGRAAQGPRDMKLPRTLEWLLDAPTLLESLAGMPNRLVRLPWLPPPATAAAAHAKRYLARFPDGRHTGEIRAWLVEYAAARGDAIEAHRIAAEDPATPPERLAELAQAAARRALEAARRQTRPDLRLEILQHTARTYPDTEAGRTAGREARDWVEESTAQRIRISRGFLLDHREVAGPEGLGLRAELLDGRLENGELHPEGVRLLGGRVVELALVDHDARPTDPPRRVRRELAEPRLTRLVALLEEAALQSALVDPDMEFEPDADRDLFLERARLGLTASIDRRPTAQSSYAFLSAREHYGMVRKRESILPVELVLQGSFDDLGLGAFPRLHPPKPTPDAILYR